MKALFALFCIFALTSAAYNPTWTQCGSKKEEFTPHSVIAIQDSKTENNTLVAACGVVKSHGYLTLFNYLTVNGSDGQTGWATQVPYKHVVSTGLPFCLNFTSDFTNAGKQDIALRISAQSGFGDEVGCVEIVLKYIEEKFLAFRI